MQINNTPFKTTLYSSNLRTDNIRYTSFKISEAQNFCGGTDIFVKSANSKIGELYIQSAKKLSEIFSKKTNEMPKDLNLTFSQENGSLLAYSKELGDNVVIRAIKKVAQRRNEDFLYVVFKEFKNGILQDTFAVDMSSGELIKLKPDGKLDIFKDDIIKYNPDTKDSRFIKHFKKVRDYAETIFGKQEFEKASAPKIADKAEGIDAKRTWRIDKSEYTDLSENLQKDVSEINDTLMRYSDLIAARRGLSSKIVQLKENYEPTIYTSKKQKNITFKYRNLESLAILHSRGNQRFTRIIHTNSNGIETHFLIDSGQKVVANLNKKRPWLTPEKYRYMTKKEIENCGIEKYIQFLKKSLNEFYDYIEKNISCKTVVRRGKSPKSESEISKFVDEISKKIELNIEKFKDEMEEHADRTASELVGQYFKILSEKLDSYSNESLREFKKNFKSFLNKYTMSVEKGNN